MTFNGGQDPEDWDVSMGLSQNPQTPGSLTATKIHNNGGAFDATLPVLPKFTFTRVAGGSVQVLDAGLEGIPPVQIQFINVPFTHAVDPSLQVFIPPTPSSRMSWS